MTRLGFCIVTGCVLLLAMGGASWAADAKNMKRYGIESGCIDYVMEGMTEGKERLYFLEWGRREARRTETSVMGMKTNTLTVIDGFDQHNIDLDAGTGTTIENTMLKSMVERSKDGDLTKMSPEILEQVNMVYEGEGKVLDKVCQIYVMKDTGAKVWFWNWIPLKTVVAMGGITMTSYAVQIMEDAKITDEMVSVPDDITMGEGKKTPEDVMKMLKQLQKGKGN